jgi:hypothetical protein
MDSFYWIVLAIAVVFLIIGLPAVSMMLRHEDTEAVFPKSHAPCPDGWKEKDGKCYLKDDGTTSGDFPVAFDSMNYGTQVGTNYAYLESSMPSGITKEQIMGAIDLGQNTHGFITFNPDATRCQKKAWADHHKIRWDGITNYNNC